MMDYLDIFVDLSLLLCYNDKGICTSFVVVVKVANSLVIIFWYVCLIIDN